MEALSGGNGCVVFGPLHDRLPNDDVAEVEDAVICSEDRRGRTAEGDVGRRSPTACDDGEETLAGSRLRWSEGKDNGAG